MGETTAGPGSKSTVIMLLLAYRNHLANKRIKQLDNIANKRIKQLDNI